MRFGRENRVRLANDFAFLKQKSKKADCSAFVFYCLPRPENSVSRLGLVTSKKVGCAVERNTARRRFRAIFRECAPDFAVPCDILVFVRRGYAKFEYAKLREKFRRAAETVIANAKKE
ncbi:MAG: ribonuclease P protein component [Candidatus Merdousia sp.]|nr:ribonuclease P protein component [Candidatus Merdousia sp.]